MPYRLGRLLFCVIAVSVFVPANAANLIANGRFEQGLQGWQVFKTENGTLGETYGFLHPVMFDINGSGSQSALEVGAGAVVFDPTHDTPFGGGVLQSVSLEGGHYSVSADVAAVNFCNCSNGEGGLFQLLIDGVPVDQQYIGGIGYLDPIRRSLSFAGLLSPGEHSIGIEIARYGWVGGNPVQYVSNIALDAVPEPETWAQTFAGFVVIGGALRTRRKTAVGLS